MISGHPSAGAAREQRNLLLNFLEVLLTFLQIHQFDGNELAGSPIVRFVNHPEAPTWHLLAMAEQWRGADLLPSSSSI
jgi:hypothetical protein